MQGHEFGPRAALPPAPTTVLPGDNLERTLHSHKVAMEAIQILSERSLSEVDASLNCLCCCCCYHLVSVIMPLTLQHTHHWHCFVLHSRQVVQRRLRGGPRREGGTCSSQEVMGRELTVRNKWTWDKNLCFFRVPDIVSARETALRCACCWN